MDLKTMHFKMVIVLKLVYRVNTTLKKILASFFAKIDKLILKFMWTVKGPRKTKTILKKKNKAEGPHVCFKTCWKKKNNLLQSAGN